MNKLICFDIGGVLVRISQSWQEATRLRGIQTKLPDSPLLMLADAEPMNRHQAGQTDYPTYLKELSDLLGCSAEDAEAAHLSILQSEYEGVANLVEELRAAGFKTACLSNTNAPHWADLTDPAKFPTVAGLDFLCASHIFKLGKPDPAIYRRFEAETGFTAAQIVFFDDNRANVESANQVGWAAFRIDPEGDTAAQMRTVLGHLGFLN